MQRTILSLSLVAGLAALAPDASASKPCPEPQAFAPGVISRPGNHWEWRLTLSPDRTVALWSAGNFFGGEQTTVLMSFSTKRGWSEPVVAPFSGDHTDMDPFFSPDGKTVYFSSLRPLEAGGAPRADFELWRVDVTRTGFGTPEHLGSGPNSGADELYPSIDRHGTLYFGSSRDGQWDVWRSRRLADGNFGVAEKLGDGVNTDAYWEFNPEISPNGRTLLFVSLFRPDGYGFGDIYRSDLRKDGAFQPAANLGPCVNSSADDYHPTMLWDERELVYIRNVIEDPDWYPDFFIVPLKLD